MRSWRDLRGKERCPLQIVSIGLIHQTLTSLSLDEVHYENNDEDHGEHGQKYIEDDYEPCVLVVFPWASAFRGINTNIAMTATAAALAIMSTAGKDV